MTTLASTTVRALVLASTALSAAPAARAIEEPAFEVLRALNDQVELRRYAPDVVAEVLVPDRGRLRPGLVADLLLVDGDPTQDIDRAADRRHHRGVFKGGIRVAGSGALRVSVV